LRVVLKKRKVLIAPLDWGLGHATRCVPIIQSELEKGHEVVLASNGRSADFLASQFPKLELLNDIPDYAVTYPANGSMARHFAKDAFRLLKVIKSENEWLKKKIEEYAFTHVISDNRYGLYSSHAHCTLITHQLNIRGPWWSRPFTSLAMKRYVDRFDECWIPDYQGDKSLAGELSQSNSFAHLKYIGPQSRFKNDVPCIEPTYEVLAIISGPEPLRSVLQNQLLQVLKEIGKPSVMLCGLPNGAAEIIDGNVRMLSHAEDEEFVGLVARSRYIVCRSGYSTLMDLYVMNRKALLIPTPGQTEQEYLAHRFQQRFGFTTLSQSLLNTENVLSNLVE
jgi:uncharacterized protein (TIGR00661 family)